MLATVLPYIMSCRHSVTISLYTSTLKYIHQSLDIPSGHVRSLYPPQVWHHCYRHGDLEAVYRINPSSSYCISTALSNCYGHVI